MKRRFHASLQSKGDFILVRMFVRHAQNLEESDFRTLRRTTSTRARNSKTLRKQSNREVEPFESIRSAFTCIAPCQIPSRGSNPLGSRRFPFVRFVVRSYEINSWCLPRARWFTMPFRKTFLPIRSNAPLAPLFNDEYSSSPRLKAGHSYATSTEPYDLRTQCSLG